MHRNSSSLELKKVKKKRMLKRKRSMIIISSRMLEREMDDPVVMFS